MEQKNNQDGAQSESQIRSSAVLGGVRTVRLQKGPSDGMRTIASHDTAIHGGEVYVWDGGNRPDNFIHAKTAVYRLDKAKRLEEKERVKNWMEHPGTPSGITTPDGVQLMLPQPMSVLIGIPPWRINAWYQLLKLEAA